MAATTDTLNQSAQAITAYYQSLLIMQYLGLPNASGSIAAVVSPVLMPTVSQETISFSAAPASGTFTLGYGAQTTAAINWNDSASTIQSDLQALTGLGSVTVSGSIASLSLVITFTGVTPPALLLTVQSNSLGVTLSIVATDIILPFQVQNAFNLLPSLGATAVGVQLDILGKYAGVTRYSYSFTGQPITLSDADFLSLIYFAIAKNNAGSSLGTIQALIHQFFSIAEILVFDYANAAVMQMSFLISTTVGSLSLIEALVYEGLLPVPMAVGYSVIYAPIIDAFFQFRTYNAPGVNGSGFNTYSSYSLTSPWLTYADAVYYPGGSI